ncbi:YceI family protein [Hyphomicrobium sp. LHD-15]|uniref:YceI family protein n=1 Tax=Hyphomicrobium sp. LHD-15 TaxID=3072142 RepID=UPI00280FAFE5|nr:YceI family protein [Hyphomicrobium sp. LHD-15]MDQ8698428.1 YceI family protein [Hyphomicrobium sp. LHD-15]
MTLRLTSLALMAALVLPGAASAADYAIDTKGAHASINFRIQHLGFSWLAGRFDQFSGTFSYDDKAPDASKVNVEIDTNSVNSNHAERDKHLRGADFLDVTKFPKATFVSKSVTPAGDGKATITGDLTLRGVTKEVKIDAAYVGGGADPWGGTRVGFTGTTKITLADYGINFNLGPASKEVELALEVEGVKQ